MSRHLPVLAALVLASCARPAAPVAASAPETAPAPLSALDQRLLEIAKEYGGYGIVDNKFSWVQTLCRVYAPPARFSASADTGTHGHKLYLLYARDWDAYVKGIESRQPAGQVIVKETWESRTGEARDEERGRAAPAEKDGRLHYPTTRHALFIMVKSDDGWKYGTVSGDGRRVFQSGEISSCAGCHQRAAPDALFGLPGRPSDR